MSLLCYDTLRKTPLKTDPYPYLVVENFVKPDRLPGIIEDFPPITQTGSLPPSTLDIRGAFSSLLEEMKGRTFENIIEDKFSVDLAGQPTVFTVRGRCHRSNGKIHTDTSSKIITVLLYLNQSWEGKKGRLRILRNGTDLDDFVEEVPPYGGTLLVFRRSEHSWHGHEPFEGPRRAVQMNWVTDHKTAVYEQQRHRMTGFLKRINPFSG